MSSPSPTVKVLLLGDPFVGKTSLRSQFIHRLFSNSYRATVGADYLSTRVNISSDITTSTTTINNNNTLNDPDSDNVQVFLQIWDTAGQERFNSLIKNFYRGADVAIFIYDVTNPSSFHNLANWINQFVQNVNRAKPAIMIVGNKCDKPIAEHLISIRQCRDFVSSNSNYIDQYLNDLQKDICYISAKHYNDVEKLFTRAAYLGYKNLQDNHESTMMTFDRVDITDPLNSPPKKGWCC